MYLQLLQQMAQNLRNFHALLEKAESFAKEKDIAPETLLQSALTEGMFPFIRQVQSFTDSAKFSAARVTGKSAPSFEDNEKTFDDLRQRIDKTVAYLETFQEEDFAESDTRPITLPFAKEFFSYGKDYFLQFSIPNFYFHYVTAYDILRQQGVDIGKRDFIGFLAIHPQEQPA
ncbi:MAG: DUF1993 domain-containing protein [Myxococcales bacterium]|nr:DUF1993 domain-containing protein [Myxococcales bacterium]MCB9644919.1 DUF1993 domain-containing protein [Myxococcales bacterium]